MKFTANQIEKIVKDIYGNNTETINTSTILDGRRNTSFFVECSASKSPVFMKIEKDFIYPRTQRHQIKRELIGNQLFSHAGIEVPIIIKGDSSGSFIGHPYIVEEFINDKLMGDCELTKNEKETIGNEFDTVFNKILIIESESYGDTFEGGIVGKHNKWISAISIMTNILLEDCIELSIFKPGDVEIIQAALTRALEQLKCETPATFFHYDLFSRNAFIKRNRNQVHLGAIFDFGMSIFAPKHYVQYITRKFTDFILPDMDVCRNYGISKEEESAYDILRLEPVILMSLIKDQYGQSIYKKQIKDYKEKCKIYLLKN